MVENAKISNATFLVIFKQCVTVMTNLSKSAILKGAPLKFCTLKSKSKMKLKATPTINILACEEYLLNQ